MFILCESDAREMRQGGWSVIERHRRASIGALCVSSLSADGTQDARVLIDEMCIDDCV